MGIEISENDRHYVNFLNTFLSPEEQIQGHTKAAQAPPAARTEHPAHRGSRHVPHSNSQPAANRKSDHETKGDEIDSLISSLFSKPEKKQGE
jgi:hypothetical protein